MATGNAGAGTEKQAAALNSVGAALALTAMKAVVGIATGSLGILAEATHSGLDLIAAWFASASIAYWFAWFGPALLRQVLGVLGVGTDFTRRLSKAPGISVPPGHPTEITILSSPGGRAG
jgi:hypothetical protein